MNISSKKINVYLNYLSRKQLEFKKIKAKSFIQLYVNIYVGVIVRM